MSKLITPESYQFQGILLGSRSQDVEVYIEFYPITTDIILCIYPISKVKQRES